MAAAAQRKEPEQAQPKMELPSLDREKPVFSQDEATVIFVLGGPGSGKGTQCAKIVNDFGFKHISAGDLLREEQDREGSKYGELIKEHIKSGEIVPMEVTVKLLENAMKKAIESDKIDHFLIDGFPRKMDQALKFEEVVVPSQFTLFFDCPEKTMEERLLDRGKTSGRADDNIDSIKKRFKTFENDTMPVVEYFEKKDKCIKIMATSPPDKVYEQVKKVFGEQHVEKAKS